jgi:hypothetical protein
MFKKLFTVSSVLIVEVVLTYLFSSTSKTSPGSWAVSIGIMTTLFLLFKNNRQPIYTPLQHYQWHRVAGIELKEMDNYFERNLALIASLSYTCFGLVFFLHSFSQIF